MGCAPAVSRKGVGCWDEADVGFLDAAVNEMGDSFYFRLDLGQTPKT